MKTIAILIFLWITGCSSQNRTLVDEELPTMQAVYQKKFNTREGFNRNDSARTIHDGDRDWNGEVKRELAPLRSEFRYLPNPVLTMYIYPHLTDAGTPVPGYATFFKFYEKDHVGLPNEFDQPMSARRQRKTLVTED